MPPALTRRLSLLHKYNEQPTRKSELPVLPTPTHTASWIPSPSPLKSQTKILAVRILIMVLIPNFTKSSIAFGRPVRFRARAQGVEGGKLGCGGPYRWLRNICGWQSSPFGCGCCFLSRALLNRSPVYPRSRASVCAGAGRGGVGWGAVCATALCDLYLHQCPPPPPVHPNPAHALSHSLTLARSVL